MVAVVAPENPKTTNQPARADDNDEVKPLMKETQKVAIATTGAFLVTYFAYRLARRKDDRANFLSAAAKFREAFTPELIAAEADQQNKINYMTFLRAAHDERHALAFSAFEPFVQANKLNNFREDWNRYRYGENQDGSAMRPDPEDMGHDELYFLEYSIEWDHRKPDRPRKNTTIRIRKLLRYASET